MRLANPTFAGLPVWLSTNRHWPFVTPTMSRLHANKAVCRPVCHLAKPDVIALQAPPDSSLSLGSIAAASA